jgi:hypothetical protein
LNLYAVNPNAVSDEIYTDNVVEQVATISELRNARNILNPTTSALTKCPQFEPKLVLGMRLVRKELFKPGNQFKPAILSSYALFVALKNMIINGAIHRTANAKQKM